MHEKSGLWVSQLTRPASVRRSTHQALGVGAFCSMVCSVVVEHALSLDRMLARSLRLEAQLSDSFRARQRRRVRRLHDDERRQPQDHEIDPSAARGRAKLRSATAVAVCAKARPSRATESTSAHRSVLAKNLEKSRGGLGNHLGIYPPNEAPPTLRPCSQ